MFRAQIVSYFTHIYYNIKLFFDVLSRKTYPQDEIPQDDEILYDFDQFTDIDNVEADNIALLRSRK
jgi:hypothetical protein